MIFRVVFIWLFVTLELFGFIIKVPETSAYVTLKQKGESHYINGYERGVVVADFIKIKHYKDVTLLPFIVSNQGSGIFYYIAVFKNDKHIISFFVGDRVDIKKIMLKNDMVVIKFYTRDKKENTKYFRYE